MEAWDGRALLTRGAGSGGGSSREGDGNGSSGGATAAPTGPPAAAAAGGKRLGRHHWRQQGDAPGPAAARNPQAGGGSGRSQEPGADPAPLAAAAAGPPRQQRAGGLWDRLGEAAFKALGLPPEPPCKPRVGVGGEGRRVEPYRAPHPVTWETVVRKHAKARQTAGGSWGPSVFQGAAGGVGVPPGMRKQLGAAEAGEAAAPAAVPLRRAEWWGEAGAFRGRGVSPRVVARLQRRRVGELRAWAAALLDVVAAELKTGGGWGSQLYAEASRTGSMAGKHATHCHPCGFCLILAALGCQRSLALKCMPFLQAPQARR